MNMRREKNRANQGRRQAEEDKAPATKARSDKASQGNQPVSQGWIQLLILIGDSQASRQENRVKTNEEGTQSAKESKE